MNIEENIKFISELWDNSIIPALSEYIRIPNKSPMFDPLWKQNGYMDQAVDLLIDWCRKNPIENMQLEVVQLEGRTPLIYIEIPGSSDKTIVLYGHMDKQPEMNGWDSDLGPWIPVIKDEKLYGRGGADDGYSIFASMAAIHALRKQQIPHARCVILIEACEESGSYDLPHYIDALEHKIGTPDLIICLDSGCSNYSQMWMTTSLRGLTGGILTIDILKQGIHSGCGSGVVPSTFLILRQLLDRIESIQNGEILLKELFVDIPQQRIEQAKLTAEVLGKEVLDSCPFTAGAKPTNDDYTQIILNRTWRPALSIIGIDGVPKNENAGNVTLPSIQVKLSMRLAPTCDSKVAAQALKEALEINPPFNAKISYKTNEGSSGWNAPPESDWLTHAAKQASMNYFGKPVMYMGEGGSIPFMGMLGKKFPKAQFLITGLLGPGSNAHGPNEFLHIPTGKKLTAAVAEIIAAHFQSPQ